MTAKMPPTHAANSKDLCSPAIAVPSGQFFATCEPRVLAFILRLMAGRRQRTSFHVKSRGVYTGGLIVGLYGGSGRHQGGFGDA